MKKAFDQTVRDFKRGVNKKVLKVPGIEQKILDATSNEPWGPHGSYLAEIAQATRNQYEYQMIMTVIWKRINDTGKNWRHVYKGLTVLEYLVAHGAERVIDDIREHAYQISTLSDFQYIDSRARDQGNNVRKKSQALVALVNDKERIQEIRDKAYANKDKFRSNFSTGTHQSSLGDRYDGDRFGDRYRDDDNYRYSQERDGSYRDDDRYGRNPDRYGRDEYNQGRSRSADRPRGRSFDDDDRHSSSGGGRADGSTYEDRKSEQKTPEPSKDALPSYEEAVNGAQTQKDNEMNGKDSALTTNSVTKITSSPPKVPLQPPNTVPATPAPVPTSTLPNKNEDDGFEDFDPRVPAVANNVEMDLFDSLAIVPVVLDAPGSDIPAELGFTDNFMTTPQTSFGFNQQSHGDSFGDAPFKATSENNISTGPQNTVDSFAPSPPTTAFSNGTTSQPTTGFDFGGTFQVSNDNNTSTVANFQQPPPAPPVAPQSSGDMLDILLQTSNNGFSTDSSPPMPPAPIRAQTAPPEFIAQQSMPLQPPTQVASLNHYAPHPEMEMHNSAPNPFSQQIVPSQMYSQNQYPQTQFPQPSLPTVSSSPNLSQSFMVAPMMSQNTTTSTVPPSAIPQSIVPSQMYSQNQYPQTQFPQPGLPTVSSSPNLSQSFMVAPMMSQNTTSTVPSSAIPQSKQKFETKSSVWADTLNRGLIDLDISGSKSGNSTVDIGVDFDSINRKEKLKEKKAINTPAPMSNITMTGKAMGSGSGIGRSGTTGIPPQSHMMRPQMGMGAPGMNMGMGGYARGQPMGMGIGQGGAPIQPGFGISQGQAMPRGVGYNPMGMGGNNYGSQQSYGGGGYR